MPRAVRKATQRVASSPAEVAATNGVFLEAEKLEATEKRPVASETSPEKVVSVLAVSAEDPDQVSLSHIFESTRWNLRTVSSLTDAVRLISTGLYPVVITDCEFNGGMWVDLLDPCPGYGVRPQLVVASRVADNRLWAQVLNLGAYDLLQKPFDNREVVRTVSLAWLQWKQRQPEPVHVAVALAS